MYCPKCGAEGGEGQNYCRQCGVNLAFVSKAVGLGDVIARGDSGLLPRIRSVVGNLQLDDVSKQVSSQLDRISSEIEGAFDESRGGMSLRFGCGGDEEAVAGHGIWGLHRKPETPAERRARLLESGFTSLFAGVALTIALFVFAGSLVLRIPPDLAARVPFEIEPVARIAWLFGLVPVFSGLGRLAAALAIRPPAEPSRETAGLGPAEPVSLEPPPEPASVVEHTTRRLERT